MIYQSCTENPLPIQKKMGYINFLQKLFLLFYTEKLPKLPKSLSPIFKGNNFGDICVINKAKKAQYLWYYT
jgi:hypothetical protein